MARITVPDGAGGEHVALQMPVVALRRPDVGVPELALHVHQRVRPRQPSRGGGVAEGVERHVAEAGVLQRRLVPVARDGRTVHRLTVAVALPPSLIALARAYRHHEDMGAGLVAAGHLSAAGQVVAQHA